MGFIDLHLLNVLILSIDTLGTRLHLEAGDRLGNEKQRIRS